MSRIYIEHQNDRALQLKIGKKSVRILVRKDGSFLLVPRDFRDTLQVTTYQNGLDHGIEIEIKET